jgi:hypothetical protein
VEDAVQVQIAATLITLATSRNDAQVKIAENALIGGAGSKEESGKIEGAASTRGVTRSDESGHSAGERTGSAAAARIAATS